MQEERGLERDGEKEGDLDIKTYSKHEFCSYSMIKILFFPSLKCDLLNFCCQLVVVPTMYCITVLLGGMLDGAK